MGVVSLFSKRRKAEARAGEPDLFQYDTVPGPFRIQVIHILRDALGRGTTAEGDRRWEIVHDLLAREKGLMELAAYSNRETACTEWFLRTGDADDALDFIDLAFRLVGNLDYNRQSLAYYGVQIDAAEATDELNHRFREHGLGYQHENGILVRLDNQYVHAQIIKPALALLSAKPFQTANEEFLTAHKHYRDRHYKDCIVAAQRAFESALKAICTVKGWPFKKGDRAAELISAVRKHGLFPDYLDKSFDTYVAMLKTGLPGVRNNAGGHGDDPKAPPIPGYLAAYALHLTAANIVLAAEAFRASEK